MKAEDLVNKEKLLAIIEKIGKAPWEKGEGVEKLIPLGAVIEAIESPAQGVSPAGFAGILKGDSWVLEKLWLWTEELLNLKGELQLNAYTRSFVIHSLQAQMKNLESQAPVPKLAKENKGNERIIKAWKVLEGIKAETKDKEKFVKEVKELMKTIYRLTKTNELMDELLALKQLASERKNFDER